MALDVDCWLMTATTKASGCFMGGNRTVREEPGKQKSRSCRAQELARAVPRKMSGRKSKTLLDSTQRESCEERKSHREARNSSKSPCPTHMRRA